MEVITPDAVYIRDQWEAETHSLPLKEKIDFLKRVRGLLLDKQQELNRVTEELAVLHKDHEFIKKSVLKDTEGIR